ncbi:hypothetical protein ACJRO7_009238 [Eucalyptus globulus]|uniref:Bidirectional sugar transporter SWEET n=1 Tax=Eucalyptus globulus TaxID=34317 RepID=A0ABD3IUJ7_EUCGL
MAIFVHPHLWIFTFGILGNFVSFFVFLAPVPTFYKIYRNKSTEKFQSIPYLVALFSSMLWLYYAFLKGHSFLLITINSFGCIIEMAYIAIYIAYAPIAARNSTIKLFALMNMGLFPLLILITHFIPNDDARATVFRWICTTISVSVFAAPLSIVSQDKAHDVRYMSFFLTLSAITWFGNGFFQKDCKEVIIIKDEIMDETLLQHAAAEVVVFGNDPGSDQPS